MLRYTTFFLALINVLALITLYVIAYRFDYTQRLIVKTQKSLNQEVNAGLAIQAEWSYLNKPLTLASLARARLQLKPIKPEQFRIQTQDE